EMLRRISTLGRTGLIGAGGTSTSAESAAAEPTGDSNGVLAPQQTLDGFGLLRPPPPTAQAVPAGKLAATRPTAEFPPGYYGPAGSPRALNLLDAKTELKPIPPL